MTSEEVVAIARTKPKISINKLAEYLKASPARRQSIVRDQKYPSPIRAPYYNEAESAVLSFFERNKNYGVIEDAMLNLGQRAPETVHKAQMASSCLDALAAFADTGLDQIDGFDSVVLPRAHQPKLAFGDVEISVRPEVLLRRGQGPGASVGLLKLYFSKGDPLTDDTANFIATACCEYLTQHLSGHGKPDLKSVLVLDVLAKKFYFAPRATKQRLKDIAAACGEISAVWKAI